MLRHITILALLALCVSGCVRPIVQPQVIVVAPRVEVLHVPDLSGCVEVDCSLCRGSGVIVGEQDGWWYCLTARHLVQGSVWHKVDGQVAEVWMKSESYDIAILRFKSDKNYRPYRIAEAKVGEACWAVGYPSIGRVVNQGRISRTGLDYVYHNAGGMTGFSGGAVLGFRDNQPVLLGITTAYLMSMVGGGPFPVPQVFDSISEAIGTDGMWSMVLTIPA